MASASSAGSVIVTPSTSSPVSTSTQAVAQERTLRQAAEAGRIADVRMLLHAGQVDVNSSGIGSLRTALHWACQRGHTDVVALLLKAHGIQHLPDAQGKTPYQLVAPERSDIKEMLTRSFKQIVAEMNLSDKELRTYNFDVTVDDMKAVWSCTTVRAMEDIVKKNNLQAPAFYVHGVPLISWLSMKDIHCIQNGKLEALLRMGADPNATPHKIQHNFYGNTALHSLLVNEAAEETIMLLKLFREKSKIPVDYFVKETKTQRTIVHFAALIRSSPVLKYILDAHAYKNDNIKCATLSNSDLARLVNQTDAYGNTALHYACLLGDVDSAVLLYTSGGLRNVCNLAKLSPMDLLSVPATQVKQALIDFHIDPDRHVRSQNGSTAPQQLQQQQEGVNNTMLRVCIQGRLLLSAQWRNKKQTS